MLFWRDCEPNFEILDVVKGRISDRFRIFFDNKVALLRLLFRLPFPVGGDGLRWLPSESSEFSENNIIIIIIISKQQNTEG